MRAALTRAEIDSSRVRLTEIATALFVRSGADALSLRNLAAAAGMSRSTPYGYFRDKGEIVDSVRAAGFDRLTARCAAELASAADPLEGMYLLGKAVVAFACDEPEVYRLMFTGPVFTGDVSRVLAAAVKRFREVSRPPLDEAIRLGLVHGNPDALRRATWAAFHGLIALHLQGHLDRRQLEADFELLNEIIGSGILTAKARGRRPARRKGARST
jgi:AcrR family transcriptional regulator